MPTNEERLEFARRRLRENLTGEVTARLAIKTADDGRRTVLDAGWMDVDLFSNVPDFYNSFCTGPAGSRSPDESTS